ncbi:unnamed protein product [Amaranthus hypochondriacus]
MAVSKETLEPSKLSLYIWFLQVIFVLLFCALVIRLCLFPCLPIYTLTGVNIPDGNIQQKDNKISVKDRVEINQTNATTILSILITNTNKRKDIIYDESKIGLYKNGDLVGETKLGGFLQREKSNVSYVALVNVNQEIRKNGILKVGLETKIRYIIIGWTTKKYFVNLEAFVSIDVNGNLLINDEGIKFEPVKRNP